MKVKVFSTNWCPYCTIVKDFLKENNIEFTEVNIGEDKAAAAEMMIKSGQQGVPVIEVDNKIVIGFDKEKLKKLLNLK
ncbi:MAG: glutathione S-transferase N-terminal domain-containing protein [Nanoarchaeota archaeon]|nr:glutathione S-transferase N-terminal domain-containing protein [Nanoarchaeota archaeon]